MLTYKANFVEIALIRSPTRFQRCPKKLKAALKETWGEPSILGRRVPFLVPADGRLRESFA